MWDRVDGAPSDALGRFAADSGGSYTRRSNDAGLAMVKAIKRMSCSYALAFRDESPWDGTRRSVSVAVNRPGLRAVYPSGYAPR